MKNANPNIYLKNKIVIKLKVTVADVAQVVACLLRSLKVGGSNLLIHFAKFYSIFLMLFYIYH